MIPAFSNVGALRRFAHRVQSQAAGEFFEIMEVFAYWSLGSEPLRLGLPDWPGEVDLDELGSTCHLINSTCRLQIREAPEKPLTVETRRKSSLRKLRLCKPRTGSLLVGN